MEDPLLTTWPEIERHILRWLLTSPPVRTRVTAAAGSMETAYGAHVRTRVRAFPPSPDAVLNTLRYMFYGMRCGILVCIRSGKLALFAPFANAAYRNAWSSRLRFTGGSASAYIAAKSAATGKRPEAWLPLEAWWMNGGILCNVAPAGVWGNAHCEELKAMIRAACESSSGGVIPDCDFFINKRDYPHLRMDGSEPYARFLGSGGAPTAEGYASYAPIFSFYTGSAFADVPIPLPEDWRLCSDEAARDVRENGRRWDETAPIAVFRGTATGSGITPETNVRIRLVLYSAAHPDVCDCRFVGYNQRDKVVAASADGITVGFLSAATLPPLAPHMSISAQIAAYRYIVYADGHCAANRYSSLMLSRRPILRVESERQADGGSLWLFHGLVGAVVDADGGEANVATADHFLILADLSNLAATVQYLRAHDEEAVSVAARAYALAPTRASIAAAWRLAMQAVAEHAAGAAPGEGKAWFSPYDSRYAQIGRRDASARMVAV
jgi:hypothetical protein